MTVDLWDVGSVVLLVVSMDDSMVVWMVDRRVDDSAEMRDVGSVVS